MSKTSTLKEKYHPCCTTFTTNLQIIFFAFYLPANKRLVYEEVKKAVERDRSMVKVSELSRHGIMEITRKRVCYLMAVFSLI